MTPPTQTHAFISSRKDVPALVFDRSRPAVLLDKLKANSSPAYFLNGGISALYVLFDGNSAFPLISHNSHEQCIIYALSPYQKYVHFKVHFEKEYTISLPAEIAPIHLNMVSMLADYLNYRNIDHNPAVTIAGGFITSGGLRQPLEISGKMSSYGRGPHERVLSQITSILEDKIGWDAIESVYLQLTDARRWARMKELMQE